MVGTCIDPASFILCVDVSNCVDVRSQIFSATWATDNDCSGTSNLLVSFEGPKWQKMSCPSCSDRRVLVTAKDTKFAMVAWPLRTIHVLLDNSWEALTLQGSLIPAPQKLRTIYLMVEKKSTGGCEILWAKEASLTGMLPRSGHPCNASEPAAPRSWIPIFQPWPGM